MQLSKMRQIQCREKEREDILRVIRTPDVTAHGFSYTGGGNLFLFSQREELRLGDWYRVRSTVRDILQCQQSEKMVRMVRVVSPIPHPPFSDFHLMQKMGDVWSIRLSKIQQQYERVIRRFLAPQSVDIILGLLMGRNPSATHGVSELFRATGLLHVLVASGANIALIFSFTQSVMRKIFSRKQSRYLATILVCIYAGMIGGDPPILRALVMFLIVLGARMVGRPIPSLLSLLLACLLLLISQPFLVYSLSFWLSVAATAGMIVDAEYHPLGNVLPFFSGSIVVSLCTMPLLLSTVGSISPLGIFLTATTAWVVSLLTILALLLFFASLLLPHLLLLPIFASLWLLSEVFLRFINVFMRFSFLTILVDPLPLPAIFLLYALLLGACFMLLAKRKSKC